MKLAWADGEVSAALTGPSDARAVCTLAHGAGGNLDDPMLVALAERLADEGIAVLRFNFPYREAGRRAPGSQKQSEGCYRAVVSWAREHAPRVFCGGKSYGGRIATHVAADGAQMDGLVLLSYPLHPPGKPERLRDAHLADVGAPMLVVQGTRDAFAAGDLLERTFEGRATIVRIEGGDHSLRVKGRPASDVQDEIAGAVVTFVS